MRLDLRTEIVRTLLFTSPLSLYVLGMCCFFGCESSIQPSDGNLTISGTTYFVGSHLPVAGVLVKCAGLSATSGADGSYLLSGVPEGVQIITAEHADCKSYSDTITVRSDTKRFIFLYLLPSRFTGFVSNVIDGPVSRARVEMHGVVTNTDSSGRYELLEVPLGTDTLRVTHPDYIAYKAPVTLTALEQKSDVVLTRETVVQGTITEDAFVDTRYPNQNYFVNRFLPLSIVGMLNGQYLTGYSIYVRFTFPSYFSDPRLIILSANLELMMESNAPQNCSYQTYAVNSTWSAGAITYNTRPTQGALLSAGLFGDGSSGKYWSFLKTSGVNTLLADWRANKPNDGIVIQGGAQNLSVASFYSLESLASPPRIRFTVRY
jgi:hypothetical protein